MRCVGRDKQKEITQKGARWNSATINVVSESSGETFLRSGDFCGARRRRRTICQKLLNLKGCVLRWAWRRGQPLTQPKSFSRHIIIMIWQTIKLHSQPEKDSLTGSLFSYQSEWKTIVQTIKSNGSDYWFVPLNAPRFYFYSKHIDDGTNCTTLKWLRWKRCLKMSHPQHDTMMCWQ